MRGLCVTLSSAVFRCLYARFVHSAMVTLQILIDPLRASRRMLVFMANVSEHYTSMEQQKKRLTE